MGLRCCEHVAASSHLVCELVVRVDRLAVDSYDAVTLLQADLLRNASCHNAVYKCGNHGTRKLRRALQHAQQVDVARQRHRHGLAVAYDVGTLGLRQVAEHVGTKILKLAFLRANHYVAVLEAHGLGLVVKLHSHRHVLR